MSVVFLDPAEDAIRQALSSAVRARATREIVGELSAVVRKTIATNFGSALDFAPEEAGPAVLAAMAAIEARLVERASYYSPMRWLWSIRRLPTDFFSGRVATTAPYDRLLAEVIATSSMAPDDHSATAPGEFGYAFGGAYPRRVAEFCDGARFLSDLHSMLRWAGKGARLQLGRDGLFGHRADPGLVEAVHAYDRRVAAPRDFPGGSPAGTVALDEVESGQDTGGMIVMVVPVHRPEQFELKPPVVPVAGYVLARFCGVPVTSTPLLRLLDDSRMAAVGVYPVELGDLLLLSRSVVIHQARFRRHYKTLLERGYVLTHLERLGEVLQSMQATDDPLTRRVEQIWGPRTVSARLGALAGARGSTWPLQAGPVLRTCGNVTCVDLAGTSERLNTLLRCPAVQGASANARAEHFEESTQALLERTPWAPPNEVRQLRGRSLKLNGRQITDIDAIAARRGTILLVSCKSIRYTSGYDTGDYREVRNAESTIVGAIEEWRGRLRAIRDSPKGDNYDLSSYQEILGVVCAPMITFVRGSYASELVAPGLHEACSLDELIAWCQGV